MATTDAPPPDAPSTPAPDAAPRWRRGGAPLFVRLSVDDAAALDALVSAALAGGVEPPAGHPRGWGRAAALVALVRRAHASPDPAAALRRPRPRTARARAGDAA